jgi:hypothetical protein
MFKVKNISDIINFLLEWENMSYIMVAVDYNKWYKTEKITTARIEYWIQSKIKEMTAVYDCIDFDVSLFPELKKHLKVLEVAIDKPGIGNITYYNLNDTCVRNFKLKKLMKL